MKTHKECKDCSKTFELSAFVKDCRSTDGVRNKCKPCHNQWNFVRYSEKRKEGRQAESLWARYKLTLAQFNAMHREQNGHCKICQSNQIKRLVVDHCHATGKVRGLLCDACNGFLGKLERAGFNIKPFQEYVEGT